MPPIKRPNFVRAKIHLNEWISCIKPVIWWPAKIRHCPAIMANCAGPLLKNPFFACKFYFWFLHCSIITSQILSPRATTNREPNLKRTICKRCGTILKPGSTADCTMNAQNRNVFQIVCGTCQFVKRFHINSKYKMWLDDARAIKETMRFDRQSRAPSSQPPKTNQKKDKKEAEQINETKEWKTIFLYYFFLFFFYRFH